MSADEPTRKKNLPPADEPPGCESPTVFAFHDEAGAYCGVSEAAGAYRDGARDALPASRDAMQALSEAGSARRRFLLNSGALASSAAALGGLPVAAEAEARSRTSGTPVGASIPVTLQINGQS